ncbi:winged helix-turn-helix domain-containing protein [Aciduliprofundum sp. MAR08-339]|uniref:winged helix-turn-helix transcriptional regulator n=1 Tax=Aciduliprofundum sp. (strain MAR08-339) TaxID=673860 RepID=UPI00064FCE8F
MPSKKISNYEILKMIQQGMNAGEIAFKVGLSKGAISQRIKKLIEMGLIELDIEKTAFQQSLTLKHVKYYRLTEKGKEEVYKSITGGEAGAKMPRVRGVHNVQFKMAIKKDADFWYDHEVALKGWVRKYTWIGNVNVEKTTKHIIIRFGVEDPDPWRAAYKALETVLNVKRLLEEAAGYELGDPVQIGKPKWEILGDPVAEEVSKKQVVVTEHGAIDSTPEPGTLHFYDVEDVITYLEMPRKIREIEQEVKQFPGLAVEISKAVAETVAMEVSKSVVDAILHPEKYVKKSSQDLESRSEEILEEVEGYA